MKLMCMFFAARYKRGRRKHTHDMTWRPYRTASLLSAGWGKSAFFSTKHTHTHIQWWHLLIFNLLFFFSLVLSSFDVAHSYTTVSLHSIMGKSAICNSNFNTHPPPGHGVATRCTQTHTHTTSLEDGPASEWEEQTVKVVPLRGRNCTTYYVERPLPLAN